MDTRRISAKISKEYSTSIMIDRLLFRNK